LIHEAFVKKHLHAILSLCLVTGFTTATALLGQSIGLSGIEVADLDQKASPCMDFYEFSNGTWRSQNPISSSMDRWSRRWQASETNKDKLRIILDDISSHPAAKGTPAQLTGDFYAARTNQKAIDAAGIKPLLPLLQQVSSIRNRTDLQNTVIALQGNGVCWCFESAGICQGSSIHNR
jgi:putative endopeptidase